MISWYLNRLRTMSIPEVIFRIRQWIQKNWEKQFVAGKVSPRINVESNGKKLSLKIPFGDEDPFPSTINIFGKTFNYEQRIIKWHRDLFSGNEFPMVFSKNIRILNNSGLSAKNVWEINRLQFLPFICMNYLKSGKKIYLKKFIEINRSWIENNPYLMGINWYSNIEVNIRLIVWFFCWLILDADELIRKDVKFRSFAENEWLPVIYMHCKYSFANPSRYSSANNHLIAEYAGLFIATSLWQFPESRKWNRYAKKGLEEEIIRQHSKDGINKEEAAEYIQFITDFFLIAYLVGERTDNPFSDVYRNILKKIFYYIYEFLDIDGNFPKYGDEDDGKCVFFDPEPHHNNFRSLLTSGAIIFKDPKLKSAGLGMDMKNRILFGEKGEKIYYKIISARFPKGSKFYPSEGHFIMRKQEDNRKEVYLHFDAAPLGYLSIAAHGHADALSFILHVDGYPVLIDPGTYTYLDDPIWRKYFIGTLAHNTIRINKQNQAVNGGANLWLRHYNVKVLKSDSDKDQDLIIAQHNGYLRYGILHKREIKFDKKQFVIRIRDTIFYDKKINYLLELPFHLHPEIKIEKLDSHTYMLVNPKGRDVIIYTDKMLKKEIVRGKTKPEITGWYSESFTRKEPADTLLGTLVTNKKSEIETMIKVMQ